MKTKSILAMAFFLLAAATLSRGAQEARVLRFPAISMNQIVFSYGGDLLPWCADSNPGISSVNIWPVPRDPLEGWTATFISGTSV